MEEDEKTAKKVIEVNGVKLTPQFLEQLEQLQDNKEAGLRYECDEIADLLCSLCRMISDVDKLYKERILEVVDRLAYHREFFQSIQIKA